MEGAMATSTATALAPANSKTTLSAAKDASTATPLPSPGIAVVDYCAGAESNGIITTNRDRPPPLPLRGPEHHDLHRNLTSPNITRSGWQSPARHHRRTPSQHREIKETTDARTQYTNDDVDGRSQHQINQYRIIEEIGRGSYGAVHRAVDHYGKEFAVKEFSKARLRRRAQSLIMRRPGLRRPIRRAATSFEEPKDALHLIRQEIAIMKKLNHDNLVQLIEVLDDPEEDSLYMVLEMCKKGPVMKIEVGHPTQPLEEEKARCCFRDLLLGIEYLHAQNICHRDIKPDNLLMTSDDVLKIVDFGVSEMFDKSQDMRTTKSAGSPAFIPPELCGKHGDVSGTAADIWSMGICLYCFKYGHLPFEQDCVWDMYESIQNDPLSVPEDEDPAFKDLISKILEKDPERRIKMSELRNHPWVTKNGEDPLLPAEENCSDMLEIPNPLELNHAFTRKISHLYYVVKAIRKFLNLRNQARERKRLSNRLSMQGENGVDSNMEMAEALVQARKNFLYAQQSLGLQPAQVPGRTAHGSGDSFSSSTTVHSSTVNKSSPGSPATPTESKTLFLGIGTGGHDEFEPASGSVVPGSAPDEGTESIVSDSPVGVGDGFDIYDQAFQKQVENIARRGKGKLFLTRLVNDREAIRAAAAPGSAVEGPPPAAVIVERKM